MSRTSSGSGSSEERTSTEANQPATAQVWLANNWKKKIDQRVLSWMEFVMEKCGLPGMDMEWQRQRILTARENLKRKKRIKTILSTKAALKRKVTNSL